MKTEEFQHNIRGSGGCMERLMMATKGCVQLTSYETYFSDIQFSGAKTAEEASTEGVDYYGR